MKKSEVRFNLDGLEEMKRQIGGTYRARVGIIGSKAAKLEHGQKLNNATLGLIQMFGSLTRKIPARDFLLMPIIRNRRELLQQLGKGKMRAAFQSGNYRQMFALLGAAAEGFDVQRRAEEIPVAEYVALAQRVAAMPA